MRILALTTLVLASCAQGDRDNVTEGQPGQLQNPNPPTLHSYVGPPFTALPLAAKDFKTMIPLGNLNPTGHVFPTDHHYFVLSNPKTSVPVYAPGDAEIIQVSRTFQQKANSTDYTVTLASSPDLSAVIMHLSSLSAPLLQAVGAFPQNNCKTYSTGGETYTKCWKSLRFKIKARTQIGTAGGLPNNRALDFAVYDRRVTNRFANPSRFVQSQYIHAVPCLSYFDRPRAVFLASRSGNWRGSFRSLPPLDGTIVLDVPGTAQGCWIRDQKPTWPEDPHLALVRDNFDPTVCAISMGRSVAGLQSGVYRFRPKATGIDMRDFADITPNGTTYTFTQLGQAGVLLVRMIDKTTLHAEWQPSSAGPPWSIVQPVVFVR